MLPASVFDSLSPHTRVATAVAPFVLALVLRLMLGKNRLTKGFITVGTVWFAVNVLAAPYSVRMQQDIQNLRYMFR